MGDGTQGVGRHDDADAARCGVQYVVKNVVPSDSAGELAGGRQSRLPTEQEVVVSDKEKDKEKEHPPHPPHPDKPKPDKGRTYG